MGNLQNHFRVGRIQHRCIRTEIRQGKFAVIFRLMIKLLPLRFGFHVDFFFWQVSKACGLMIDMGKVYVNHQNMFTNSLWDLNSYFKEDPIVAKYLEKLIYPLQEMNTFQSILLDQASRIIMKNLTAFVKK